MATPLISVVIPAYNMQDLISQTLDSVVAQTHKDFEIVVIDDGSTDGTGEAVARYSSLVRCYRQENAGAGVARNTGMRHSRGEYICFMDADDLMAEDRLERQLDFLRRNASVGVAFCDYRNFDERGAYPRTHFETCVKLSSQLAGREELVVEAPRALLVQENFGCAGTLFMRKNLLRYEQGFDPALRTWEDLYFYYRLARHTAIGVLNRVGMLRRFHKGNTTANTFQMCNDGIASCQLLLEGEDDAAIRAHLERHIAICRRGLARAHADQGHYLQALQKEVQALRDHFSPTSLRAAGKGVARTLAMAAGLHHPDDRKR